MFVCTVTEFMLILVTGHQRVPNLMFSKLLHLVVIQLFTSHQNG